MGGKNSNRKVNKLRSNKLKILYRGTESKKKFLLEKIIEILKKKKRFENQNPIEQIPFSFPTKKKLGKVLRILVIDLAGLDYRIALQTIIIYWLWIKRYFFCVSLVFETDKIGMNILYYQCDLCCIC